MAANITIHTSKQQVEGCYGAHGVIGSRCPIWLATMWHHSKLRESSNVGRVSNTGHLFEVCGTCYGNCGQCGTSIGQGIPADMGAIIVNCGMDQPVASYASVDRAIKRTERMLERLSHLWG